MQLNPFICKGDNYVKGNNLSKYVISKHLLILSRETSLTLYDIVPYNVFQKSVSAKLEHNFENIGWGILIAWLPHISFLKDFHINYS